MAGLFQIGDFVNFGRLAWQVYQYGWREEHNAGKHLLVPYTSPLILKKCWPSTPAESLSIPSFAASPGRPLVMILEPRVATSWG